MKKKIFITLGILFSLILITYGGIAAENAFNAPKHPSDYHIGISYDEAIQKDKPMLVVFYADWCGYCLRFMPKFNTLSKIYKNKFNFVMLNVEATEANRKLAEEVALGGYPTVYIIDPKYDNRVLFSNRIYKNLSKFRVELDRFLRIRALLDKA